MSQSHDDLVHLVFDAERLTFREVRLKALSLARELRNGLGVAEGDRVDELPQTPTGKIAKMELRSALSAPGAKIDRGW